MHFRLRHDRPNSCAGRIVGRLRAEDMAAPGGQITEHVPEGFLGHDDLDFVEGLEQYRLALGGHGLECLDAGHLERHLVRVDRVVGAVEQLDLEVHERETGQDAPLGRFMDPLLNGRDELARNRSAHDMIFEADSVTALGGEDTHPAIAELSSATRLLLVPALSFRSRPNRLTVRDLRFRQFRSHAEFALELRERHLEVTLTHPRHDGFVCFRVPMRLKRRVLVVESVQSLLQLLFVDPIRRMNRHLHECFRKHDLWQAYRMGACGQGVVRMGVAQFRYAADVAGVQARHLDPVAAVRHRQMIQLLHAVSRCIEQLVSAGHAA